MSALHMVFSVRGLAACAERRADDDAVVLLGDGVYCASLESDLPRTFVLADDLAVRGATNPSGLEAIGYDELVALCARHQPIVSWND